MGLQRGAGPLLADAALNRGCQRPGLVVAVDQDQHLAGVHHRADAHGQRLRGHLFRVVSEEAAVDDAGVAGQHAHAGAAGQGGEGLVEGQVAVHADAAQEQVDAAQGRDLRLIGRALGLGILGHAVEDVHVCLGDVDVIEEVGPHEVPVALVVLPGQAQVFVHVEGHHVPEGDLAGLVHPRQLGVHAQGRGAGGQPQHEGPVAPVGIDLRGNVGRGPLAHLLVILLNDNAHCDTHSFILIKF